MEDTLIQEALKNFTYATTQYGTQRSEAREALKMVAGLQQPNTANDPYALKVNLLNPFLRQICAEGRQANPAIHVIPDGEGGTEEIAEVRGGIIRDIEQKCDAEAVYDKALWYAAASGEGYMFLDSEYVSDDSFDQNLVIKPCFNPEMVFLDPGHQDPTGHDAEWGFVVKDMVKDAYIRQFGKSKLADTLTGVKSFNRLTIPNDWLTDQLVRVAQYWVKEYKMKRVWYVLHPPSQEFPHGRKETVDVKPGPDVVVLKTREVQQCYIKGYTINAVEVLEKIDWPGKRIPIFKVPGDQFYIGGQLYQGGAIRHMIDPQRQYNYACSRQMEILDLAPKNSFVLTQKQMGTGDDAQRWVQANQVSYGALTYVSDAGAPPPTRVSGLDTNAFNAIASSRSQAYEALKLVSGLNDASMGNPGNEISGVAIENRVEQGSRSSYHYFDNLLLCIKALGREINNLIPVYYDTDRIVRIVKPTDEEELVAINSVSNNFKYDLTGGNYSVHISTGPAYASKRDEALTALKEIMALLPESSQVIGDLAASQIDSPIAKIAAARIKATIPPAVLAATGDGNKSDMAPKEQVQQLQMQLAQATQLLQQDKLQMEEMKVKLKTLEDQHALELTKMDMKDHYDRDKLKQDAKIAEIEAHIRLRELALEEMKLKLSAKELEVETAIDEKKLELDITMAQHEVVKGMHPDAMGIPNPNADLSEDNISSGSKI